MLIDLTHTIRADTPVWPGDNPIQLTAGGDSEMGVLNHVLTCSMHVGTHMDGPRHMLPEGKFLHEFSVEKFCGRGVLLDARGKEKIDVEILSGVDLQKGDIVFVYTGLSEHFAQPSYFEKYPHLTPAFAEKLIEAKASIVGLDFCSPDAPPFEIHRMLLKHEILIIENLTGLSALSDKNFEAMALPLKTAADSAPVRVIATL